MRRPVRISTVVAAALAAAGMSVPLAAAAHADPPETLWIKSVSTARCLDSSNPGSVNMGDCNPGSFQQWGWWPWGQDSAGNQLWKITNIARQQCLDSNGSSVYVHGCVNDDSYQLWRQWPGRQIQHMVSGACLTDGAGVAPPDQRPDQDWRLVTDPTA